MKKFKNFGQTQINIIFWKVLFRNLKIKPNPMQLKHAVKMQNQN